MKKILFLQVVAVLGQPFFSQSVLGGPVTLIKQELRPLVHSTQGRITGCGVHFAAAVTAKDRLFSFQGSITRVYPEASIPFVAFKLVAVTPVDGSLAYQPVSHAYVRKGAISTTRMEAVDGAANGAWTQIWAAPASDSQEWIELPDIVLQIPTVGVNLGQGDDMTFQLQAPEDDKIYEAFLECEITAGNQIESE